MSSKFVHGMQYAGFLTSWITNPILIFLVITRPKNLVGKYYLLMLLFSCFSMFYALIEVLTLPTMHITEAGLIIFLDSWISEYRNVGVWIVVIYTGCYTMCLGLLTNQFVYRYFVIKNKDYLRFYDGFKFFLTYSHAIIASVLWPYYVSQWLTPTNQSESLFREDLRNFYGVDISNVTFVTCVYYTYDSIGNRLYNTSIFVGCGLLSLYMCCCIFTIIYCAIKIYAALNDNLFTFSHQFRILNRQILKSLIIQTFVPMATMYIPVGLLLIFPFFELKIGSLINFVGMSMSIYPAIDPIIAIFLVDEFRVRITGRFQVAPMGHISTVSNTEFTTALR